GCPRGPARTGLAGPRSAPAPARGGDYKPGGGKGAGGAHHRDLVVLEVEAREVGERADERRNLRDVVVLQIQRAQPGELLDRREGGQRVVLEVQDLGRMRQGGARSG